jgi:hypothetical protein
MKNLRKLLEGTKIYKNIEYHTSNKEESHRDYRESTYVVW